MEKIISIFGGAILVLVGLMILIPLGTLFGAISGWVVGIFFGDTILDIVSQLGVKGVTMWQFGAFLGFTGAFFRTTNSTSSK